MSRTVTQKGNRKAGCIVNAKKRRLRMQISRLHFATIICAVTIAAGTTYAQPGRVDSDHYVAVGNCKLHYRTGGTGPYLLMLHGFTLSSEQWLEYFDDFSSDYTVIAFDLPGHGKSDRHDGAFSYEHWAELILQALERLDVHAVFGMGHSAGAITLLYMADKKPQLFKGLVLVAGSPVMSTAGRDMLLYDSFEKADAPMQTYYMGIHFGDTTKIKEIFSDVRFMASQVPTLGDHPPIMERLKQFTAPVFMVWGDRDPYFPMEITTTLYKTFPNAQLWVIPFQGHAPVWETFGADAATTERFAESVRRFLSASNSQYK